MVQGHPTGDYKALRFDKRDSPPILVCGEEHRFLVAEQLRVQNRFIYGFTEPVAKNTAPALAYAANYILKKENAIFLFFHLIISLAMMIHFWKRAKGSRLFRKSILSYFWYRACSCRNSLRVYTKGKIKKRRCLFRRVC